MAEDVDIEKAAGVAPSGGSKLVPVLLVANMALVATVLAVFLLRGSGGGGGGGGTEHATAAAAEPGKPAAKADESAPPGPTVKLADFVIHLRNVDSDRYARLSFEVEVATEEDKNRIGALMPRVRDGFIAYLSDRTLEELRGSEAIGRTKAALEERLARMTPGVKVKALYVTDLVIQ
jgi:flagellar FliL protein